MQPLIVLDPGPASFRVRENIGDTGERVVGRSHPSVEVGSPPDRCRPAMLRAEPVRRHSFPRGRETLSGRTRKGTHQRVDVVIHHDRSQEFREVRLAGSDDLKYDLPFLGPQWRLVSMKPPGEADGPPGLLPVRYVTARRQCVHERGYRNSIGEASPGKRA